MFQARSRYRELARHNSFFIPLFQRTLTASDQNPNPLRTTVRTQNFSALVCSRSRVSFKLVGLGRLELPTPRLSSVCSNQLSYRPNKQKPQISIEGRKCRWHLRTGMNPLKERADRFVSLLDPDFSESERLDRIGYVLRRVELSL